ncbi:hypothetical protein RJT34_08420 [Clitoria ternatea]|uniref:Phosphorylated adapter RNA export protein n=1 Tax=Clitoria ternatea TaxID=43366 RepID=A0AAN9K666_CLITE
MENGENILDAIYEEDELDDVEMVDAEEGELVQEKHHPQTTIEIEEGELEKCDSQSVLGQNGAVEADNKKPQKNRKRRDNKKRNKRKKASATGGSFDINRFVLDTCRQLKEKKSYMVYTAVGCLGVSALNDLVKEVDAIQACGGQKTLDGKRFRTGGGILWNIIKVREPNAFKEIMKKAKDFEKQFRQSVKKPPVQKKEDSSQGAVFTLPDEQKGNVSDNPLPALRMQDQHEASGSEGKRNSVHDRLRIPVSYDDDLLGPAAEMTRTEPNHLVT